MIDIHELRRLAQAASHPTTKGRWVRLFGERTVYDRMEDGCRGIPVVSTDKHPPSSFEAACLDFIAAVNPAVINSLLDRLEAAESDAIEQARLNGMGSEREAALMSKLEAAEKERDFAKTEIARLHDDIRELTDERALDEEERELWAAIKAKSAEKENAKLREALVEKVVSETMLRDLSIRNGSIHASFDGGAMHLLVDAFVEQFVESGATNYIEMQFHSNVTGPLVVTLQRVNGKTAHQLRAEAEKERDALRLELTDLRNSMTFRTALIGRIESEREDLHALIATVKKQVSAEFRLRMKKEIECNALRAEIEAMRRQEPVAWARKLGLDLPSTSCVTDLKYRPSHIPESAYISLYASPGAQPAPSHALDDNATIAGLESAVTHLSVLLDSFRALLVEVNDVCGRDGHGGQLEDGESEIIDKVRAAISMTEAPPAQKEKRNEYRIRT